MGRRRKAVQRCRAWVPRLESVFILEGLPWQFANDLGVHCRVYYDPHMVRVVTRFLVGVIDGVHDDRQCFQFPVRGGPEDGSPCEVVLVESACRVRRQLQTCPPGCWSESCGARGIRKNDGVVVVRVQRAARRRWLVGMDVCPPFRGGPWRGGGRLESLGSIHAHPLADNLGCRWVHADIVVVPLVALCQVAVHIFEQVRFLLVECGPLDRLPVLDLGASVFNRVGRVLWRGTAMCGCLGAWCPTFLVGISILPRLWGAEPLWPCPSPRPVRSACVATGVVRG